MKPRLKSFSRASWICAVAALASCGSNTTSDASATDVAHDVAAIDVAHDTAIDAPAPMDVLLADASDVVANDDVLDAGPYPAGPYGNAQGDVLANLSWEGYVNPAGHVVSTMLPYTPTSMQAMRTLGRRYALVHVAEFY